MGRLSPPGHAPSQRRCNLELHQPTTTLRTLESWIAGPTKRDTDPLKKGIMNWKLISATETSWEIIRWAILEWNTITPSRKEYPQVVVAADLWWNKDFKKFLLSMQCNVPCNYIKPALKKSNNAESTRKRVNSYIFATTFTPTNHATLYFWKPGDARLVSCDTDSSLDDFTFPTEQCIDLYDALSVRKLISMRKFR